MTRAARSGPTTTLRGRRGHSVSTTARLAVRSGGERTATPAMAVRSVHPHEGWLLARGVVGVCGVLAGLLFGEPHGEGEAVLEDALAMSGTHAQVMGVDLAAWGTRRHQVVASSWGGTGSGGSDARHRRVGGERDVTAPTSGHSSPGTRQGDRLGVGPLGNQQTSGLYRPR